MTEINVYLSATFKSTHPITHWHTHTHWCVSSSRLSGLAKCKPLSLRWSSLVEMALRRRRRRKSGRESELFICVVQLTFLLLLCCSKLGLVLCATDKSACEARSHPWRRHLKPPSHSPVSFQQAASVFLSLLPSLRHWPSLLHPSTSPCWLSRIPAPCFCFPLEHLTFMCPPSALQY